MNQIVKEKKSKKIYLNYFSKKNNIIRISNEILNEIKEKNKIEEIRYNKLLEEQKYLPKLLPLLKPVNNDYSQSNSFEYLNDNYDDDFTEKNYNYMNEKNYNKNNINNYINKNRFYKNNSPYQNRNYYNNKNYYKNNNNYSYNSNIKINDTLNKDFEEFQFFQEFINLKYAPLYYKNY